jgi:hypothetical protein
MLSAYYFVIGNEIASSLALDDPLLENLAIFLIIPYPFNNSLVVVIVLPALASFLFPSE